MRVLLVEDDSLLGAGLVAGLKQSGYTVDWVRDGLSAEHALATENFDMLVLDLGLPRKDGLSVLTQLRSHGNDLPVLILTARDTVSDRISGLDAGADDYLVKPFDLDELAARLRAISRRRNGRAQPLLKHGNIELDQSARSVTLNGQSVPLGSKEYVILETLIQNAGRALSRDRLEESLYGWNEGIESNAIEVFIHHLRKKFGKELIRTIRGIGYMIPKNNS